MGDYQELSLNRARLALLIGALVGSPLVVTAEMVSEAPALAWLSAVGLILFLSLVGFFFAVFGLFFIAAPAWWLLHKAGMTSWVHALMLGVVLTFCYAIAIWFLLQNGQGSDRGGQFFVNGVPTPHGWYVAIQSAVPAAIAGGLVGLIVWRIAYRRLKSVDD